MSPGSRKPRNIDRLVYLPVLGALVVMWITLATYTLFERKILLERAQSRLDATVSTLAGFNELAAQATGSGSPTLNPTLVTQYELSWTRLVQRLAGKVRLGVFGEDTRDLQDLAGGFSDAIGVPYSLPSNIGSQRQTSGAEVERRLLGTLTVSF